MPTPPPPPEGATLYAVWLVTPARYYRSPVPFPVSSEKHNRATAQSGRTATVCTEPPTEIGLARVRIIYPEAYSCVFDPTATDNTPPLRYFLLSTASAAAPQPAATPTPAPSEVIRNISPSVTGWCNVLGRLPHGTVLCLEGSPTGTAYYVFRIGAHGFLCIRTAEGHINFVDPGPCTFTHHPNPNPPIFFPIWDQGLRFSVSTEYPTDLRMELYLHMDPNHSFKTPTIIGISHPVVIVRRKSGESRPRPYSEDNPTLTSGDLAYVGEILNDYTGMWEYMPGSYRAQPTTPPTCFYIPGDGLNLRNLAADRRQKILATFPLGSRFTYSASDTEDDGISGNHALVELVEGPSDRRFIRVPDRSIPPPLSPTTKLLSGCASCGLVVDSIPNQTESEQSRIIDCRKLCWGCGTYHYHDPANKLVVEFSDPTHYVNRIFCTDCRFTYKSPDHWRFCPGSNVLVFDPTTCVEWVTVEGSKWCKTLNTSCCFLWSDGTYHRSREPGAVEVLSYHHGHRPWLEAHPPPNFLGTELELLSKDAASLAQLAKKANELGLIAERDSSLNLALGVEIVGPPMAILEYQRGGNRWDEFIKFAQPRALGWRAGAGYGMHVSYGRAGLSDTTQVRMLQLVNNNPRIFNRISGRLQSRHAQYCRKHDVPPGHSIADYWGDSSAPGGHDRKYEALALRSPHRMELRIFRSTLKWMAFLKNVEVTQAIRDFSLIDKADPVKFLAFLVSDTGKKLYPNYQLWLAEETETPRAPALSQAAERDAAASAGKPQPIPDLEKCFADDVDTLTPDPDAPPNPVRPSARENLEATLRHYRVQVQAQPAPRGPTGNWYTHSNNGHVTYLQAAAEFILADDIAPINPPPAPRPAGS